MNDLADKSFILNGSSSTGPADVTFNISVTGSESGSGPQNINSTID